MKHFNGTEIIFNKIAIDKCSCLSIFTALATNCLNSTVASYEGLKFTVRFSVFLSLK